MNPTPRLGNKPGRCHFWRQKHACPRIAKNREYCKNRHNQTIAGDDTLLAGPTFASQN
ncbi:hypothetical protein [Paraburkholderia bannensis]|uniref:hypothetical protein n=1 Tax=Paraburkholderia bannensis TaxID=765414 RepID=UPI002AB1B4C0|nr:hypothetical protein [Paraburkholderia bannensis]